MQENHKNYKLQDEEEKGVSEGAATIRHPLAENIVIYFVLPCAWRSSEWIFNNKKIYKYIRSDEDKMCTK